MRKLWLILLILGSRPLMAESPSPSPQPQTAPSATEASVDEIREQYWAKGRQGGLGVVQNRNHPRRNRLEIAATGGLWLGSPYLSIKTLGASLGFHVSEAISIHAVYTKAYVGPSSALQDLLNRGLSAETNEPRSAVQGEVRYNWAYGKLALTGTELVYLDSNLVLGVGRVLTQTGGSLLLSAGMGERFHLGKSFSIDLDYRLLTYRETFGTVSTSRSNVSHSLTLGLSVFFDFSPSEAAPAAAN